MRGDGVHGIYLRVCYYAYLSHARDDGRVRDDAHGHDDAHGCGYVHVHLLLLLK